MDARSPLRCRRSNIDDSPGDPLRPYRRTALAGTYESHLAGEDPTASMGRGCEILARQPTQLKEIEVRVTFYPARVGTRFVARQRRDDAGFP
jgi:hypothetical protein